MPPNRLVVAIEGAPRSLDPRFATDAHSARISALVFRGLTRSDGNGRRLPDLAREWNVEDGGRTVVFRLRAARFHDGSPVTAEDVRATFESVLDPATASPKRAGLDAVERIEAVDPSTVVLRLRHPFAAIVEASGLGVLPAAEAGSRKALPTGSGPFRVAASGSADETRLVAASPDVAIRDLVFRVVPDDTVRALELERGSIQLAENAIEPQNLSRLAGVEHLCVRRVPGSTFHYLGLNLRAGPLADRRVRAAIAAAVDRGAIVASLQASTATVATGLFSPTHWVYEGDVERHPYDPERARRLLDEAGLADPDGPGPRTRFTLVYKTTPLESRRRLAAAIQAYLAAVGIGVEIRSLEWGTFYADIRRGDFQIHSLAWIGIEDPDLAYHLFQSSMTPPRGDNRWGYARAEVDELTRRGRASLDPAERRSAYADVQRLVAADLPLVPLWWSDTIVVHDRRLRGFVPAPDGDLGSLATATLDETSSGSCDAPPAA